jgi:hypothetical protein
LYLLDKIQLLLITLLLSAPIFAQQNKLATIELHEAVSAYVDRPGDLYILQKDNSLLKFDTLGQLLYKKQMDKNVTVFDPRDGARMFTYQKETGKCSFYSEETKQEFLIEQQHAIEPTLACSSGDHNIWLFDHADFSIKKINSSTSKVVAESVISQKQFTAKPQILALREYQNFLFVLEKNSGILIFNSLGIQIKKIPVTGIDYINFLGEELYYKKNNKLIFHDLFDSTVREVDIDPTCNFALLTDSRRYLVYPNRVDFFRNR